MTKTDVLQRFKQLDRSSPQFPDQLVSLLHQKEYKECIPNLLDEEVVWLVNYLDRVCLYLPCPPHRPLLSVPRSSNFFNLIPPAQRSEGVYVNSGGSAAPDNSSPSHTYLKIPF